MPQPELRVAAAALLANAPDSEASPFSDGAPVDGSPGPEPRYELTPVRLTAAATFEPPGERFVLGSMIPLGKASVLYGPTSVGKSALASQVALAFAAGAETLWGLSLLAVEEEPEEPPVHGGPVLVYTAEDTLEDWIRKAAAIRHDGAINVDRALERLYVVDQSEGVARLSEVVTVRSGQAVVLSRRISQPTDEQEALIRAAKAVRARFILVETASRLVEDEDNANMSALQSALGRIARETGAAVLVTHHVTKAASKEGDSSIESARGGGAFVANARNALSLFPAEQEVARSFAGRFPAEDVLTLAHAKGTSSTRRQAPLTLIRTDAKWGAVFRRPADVELTPEQDQANSARVETERRREWEQLARLYDVVAELLRLGPVSQSRLRERVTAIGVPKRNLETLVLRALDVGVLKGEAWTGGRGRSLVLGRDPRRPICESGTTGDDPGNASTP